jgi:hypothetical protein
MPKALLMSAIRTGPWQVRLALYAAACADF